MAAGACPVHLGWFQRVSQSWEGGHSDFYDRSLGDLQRMITALGLLLLECVAAVF